MAQVLNGKEISKKIRNDIKEKVALVGQKPALAIVLAGDDKSAITYAKAIQKSAENVGITAKINQLETQTGQDELNENIRALAENKDIHGIIIQSPVANHIDLDEARSLIPPDKDIDGANPLSSGRLYSGLAAFAPATARAVIEILKYYQIEIAGKHAVVIGRSQIIGKPAANMLLDLDATVTICHSKTKQLENFTKSADILVVAAGKDALINKNHIDPIRQTVVVDVGTNFNSSGEMVGDVDFEDIKALVKSITPVPGGVGPVTTAILLEHTLRAYLNLTGQNT